MTFIQNNFIHSLYYNRNFAGLDSNKSGGNNLSLKGPNK